MAYRTAGLPRSQLIAIALIFTLGIGFRFYGLDHKVYWHDEVFTSLRAAGYSGEVVSAQLLNQSATAADLQQFQRRSPDKTWADTWASLKTHPEHPPLFYLLERAWMGAMGSSVAATRGLALLFSIVLFPLLVWFCNGLAQGYGLAEGYGLAQGQAGGSPLDGEPSRRSTVRWGRDAAAVAIALLAVSPVQVLYAQEAREYSLWACEILLASGLLLRAMQMPRRWESWLGYGLAMALALYTTLLSGLVIIAHGVFVIGNRLRDGWGGAKSAEFCAWLSSVLFAVLLFTPWLIITALARQKLQSVTAWTQVPVPLGILSKLWGLHLSASFIDLGLPLDHAYSCIAPAAVLLIVSLSWLAIPLDQGRWLLLAMLVVPALLLMLPDLIQGGQRSSVTRYFIPLVLMALVTLALGITKGLRSAQSASRFACQLLLVGLLTMGTVSCYRSAIAPAWWNKSFNFVMPAMADYITQAQRPQPTPVWIELGGNGLGNAIALSHLLPADTAFYFFKLPDLPPAPESSVLVPYASGDLMAAAQKTYGQPLIIVQAPGVYELWQLRDLNGN